MKNISTINHASVDYFEIVSMDCKQIKVAEAPCVILVAVKYKYVRLIDNIIVSVHHGQTKNEVISKKFDEIYEVIYRTFDKNNMSNELSLETINEIDMLTRIEAKKVVNSIA